MADPTSPKQTPRPEAIPVLLLMLKPEVSSRMTGLIRGSGSDAIKASTDANRTRCSITFHPQMRHHRVEVLETSAKEARVVWIHETNVTHWEPVPS